MTNLGRNDPCYCGSGKKYKKCHLDADERQSDAQPESPPAFVDVSNLPTLLRHLSENAPVKDREKFTGLLASAEPLVECMARREEIEAAGAALGAHRASFDELARDEDRYLTLSQAVFAEDCFAPLRFTASDVQRAFDHVGHPVLELPDEQTVTTLRAAILHLADKERRSLLSIGLLTRLPDFVRAGRYMEGWLVQCAALDTVENSDESNSFLFDMFSFGYEAWAAGKRGKNEALLRTIGIDLDRLRDMDLNDFDSWVQSQTSDPAKVALLEECFRDNPRLCEESVAHLEAMERNSTKLLERKDSCRLLLPSVEVQPWIALFNERFSRSDFFSAPNVQPSEESARRMFEELALPLMREMAESIFSPDRIQQLVYELKKYRNDRFSAGDKTAAEHAVGAINYLAREDSPGENSFLLSLCWRSLEAAIKTETVADDPHEESRERL